MRKAKEVRAAKLRTPPGKLCHGAPRTFSQLLVYARHLDFADRPDYARIRGWFERDLENERQHEKTIIVSDSQGPCSELQRSEWGEEALSTGPDILLDNRASVRCDATTSY